MYHYLISRTLFQIHIPTTFFLNTYIAYTVKIILSRQITMFVWIYKKKFITLSTVKSTNPNHTLTNNATLQTFVPYCISTSTVSSLRDTSPQLKPPINQCNNYKISINIKIPRSPLMTSKKKRSKINTVETPLSRTIKLDETIITNVNIAPPGNSPKLNPPIDQTNFEQRSA